MRQEFNAEHWCDGQGNPAGGCTSGMGFTISWQNGPLGRHAEGCERGKPCVQGCTRREPNGAFVEGIIAAAIDRLEFYQASRFKCMSNAAALASLYAALDDLDARTREREAMGIEGTHEE